jgi:DNA polymerase-3 subunit delta
MKLKTGQIEGFIRRPDPAIRAILVYGPDDGLARERAQRLANGAVSDPDDPFLVAHLSGEDISADPPRLLDEAAAIPLTGGRRVVRVRDASPSAPGAGESIANAVRRLLEDPPGDSLVIMQAGDLGPRAPLRKLFESAANGAALPCYADQGAELDRLIAESLETPGISLSPDARAWLTANLGSDRGVTRSELEKLALYAGDDGRLELADVQACIGDNGLQSMDRIVMAAGAGDRAELDRALAAGLQEGQNPVTILRAMNWHLQRLQWIKAGLSAGQDARRAVHGLQPPVFVMHVDRFAAQARCWSEAALAKGMAAVLEAEKLCKETGTPAEAVCGRALLQITALAATK